MKKAEREFNANCSLDTDSANFTRSDEGYKKGQSMILLIGYSTIPLAPAAFRRGTIMRT